MLVKKITAGFVVQTFDTTKKEFVSQEFVAGDPCDYEDKEGNPLDAAEVMPQPEPYLPFQMQQPTGLISTVNVIESAEGDILGLASYGDTPEGNTLAEARFRSLCKENTGRSRKDIEAFIEDGSAEHGTWRTVIFHSTEPRS